jgi:hypothetical protein
MNKITLITAGIVLILLMGGLWGYLFFYGAPEKPKEVFSNLGIIGGASQESVRTVTDAQVPQDVQLLSLRGTALEQLTTRLVAGFGLRRGEAVVRYAEQGTGHIFEIDLSSGLERQISRTTIAETVEGIFSQEGTSVALITHEGGIKNTHIGRITDSGELSSVRKLPQNASDVAFEGEVFVYYTISGERTVVRRLDLRTLEESTIVTLPLAEVHVSSYDQSLVFAPKPAAELYGALYSLKGNTLNPLSPLYEEFIGFMVGDIPVYTYTEDDSVLSEAVIQNSITPQSIPFIPEKCTPHKTGAIWCAAPASISPTFITQWYKGIRSFEDYLWLVDLPSGDAGLIANLSELAKKTIDVYGLTIDADQKKIFFINKVDGYLWIYTI